MYAGERSRRIACLRRDPLFEAMHAAAGPKPHGNWCPLQSTRRYTCPAREQKKKAGVASDLRDSDCGSVVFLSTAWVENSAGGIGLSRPTEVFSQFLGEAPGLFPLVAKQAQRNLRWQYTEAIKAAIRPWQQPSWSTDARWRTGPGW